MHRAFIPCVSHQSCLCMDLRGISPSQTNNTSSGLELELHCSLSTWVNIRRQNNSSDVLCIPVLTRACLPKVAQGNHSGRVPWPVHSPLLKQSHQAELLPSVCFPPLQKTIHIWISFITGSSFSLQRCNSDFASGLHHLPCVALNLKSREKKRRRN